MLFNPITLRKTKIAYNFGLSECNRVKDSFLICIVQFEMKHPLDTVYCLLTIFVYFAFLLDWVNF